MSQSGLKVAVRFKRWDDRQRAIDKMKKELDFILLREIAAEQWVEGILTDFRFVNLAKGFGNVDQVTVLDVKPVQY